MSPQALYTCSTAISLVTVTEDLAALLSVRRRTIERYRVTYLDTFDGRVTRSGGCLTVASEGERTRLEWRPGHEHRRFDVMIDRPVGFASDLPDCPLRDRLEPIIAMRRLLPIVTVERGGSVLDVLDEEHKTVARIRVESGRARAPKRGARWRPLPTLLTLSALQGYDADFRRLLPIVESRPGFQACPDGLQALALHTIDGTAPRDMSALDIRLEPLVRADDGARQIHRALLAIMVANEPGVRDDLDMEFLHDFRVAIRRTRSLLTQIKGVLPKAAVNRYKNEFAWLGQITGPTRDLDVLLLALRESPRDLDENDLADLRSHLMQDRRRKHRRLVQQLESPRYHALMTEWRRFLKGQRRGARQAKNAAMPLATVVSRRAWRLYRHIVARADDAHGTAPPQVLHQTRIDAKKLRYLIDTAYSLYSARDLRKALGALKRLQTVLGDFNDACVQEVHLREQGRILEKNKPEHEGARRAAEFLAKYVHDRAEHLRKPVAKELARFCDAKMRSHFQRVFRVQTTKEA